MARMAAPDSVIATYDAFDFDVSGLPTPDPVNFYSYECAAPYTEFFKCRIEEMRLTGSHIHCLLRYGSHGEAQAGDGGDLIFSHKFKNFELELEWKISKGGNSGILYLAQEVTTKDKDGNTVVEPIYISAPEYQVLDNANHPDAKLGKDNNRQSASLYDMIPAVPQNAKPFGEWNKAKIMVYKGTVVHGQNDQNVLEYHLWTPKWTEMLQASKFSETAWPLAFELLNNCGGENHEGYIGLQDHGDDVWYRNIRVKILD